MNEKLPIPIAIIEPPILQNDNIFCEENEKQDRLNICKDCENFYIKDLVTQCKKSGCSINLLITFKFKECPISKW